MNVPNHEKKAFKDMTPEERSAIVEAWIAGNTEVYRSPDGMWADKGLAIYIYKDAIYRTRPRQLVIPWEHIKPEYKWAAMDECGQLSVHGKEPQECIDGWWSENEFCISALAINTAGIDWRESLTQRPEGV